MGAPQRWRGLRVVPKALLRSSRYKGIVKKGRFAFFDVNKSTKVTVKASLVGLEAVLSQFESEKPKKQNDFHQEAQLSS